MKSKIRYRCTYVLGVLAATTIVTCTTGKQVISANEVSLASHQIVQDPHLDQRTITRTICYRRPDNGQQVAIKQVVSYQTKDGQTAPVTMTLWPEYYLPYFKGYCPEKVAIPAQAVKPNDQSTTIEIKYRPEKYRPAMEQQKLVTYFDFYDASGKLIAEKKSAQPYYQMAAFPQPPAGYEYVNPEQIPSQYQVYFANSASHTLLVQLIQHHHVNTESKRLVRQITCHLPNEEQIITQPLTLTRQVTITSPQFNKRVVTPWQIVNAKQVELPQVKGYLTPELPALPVEISDESQIKQPIDVYYQPDERPIDEEVQVDMKAHQQDDQTQTDIASGMQDQATMTENVSCDATTSTADLKKTKEAEVQTNDPITSTITTGTDDLIPAQNTATQTDQLGVDAASGDSEVNVKDQESQVGENQTQAESTQTTQAMVDKGSSDDGSEPVSVGTQSEVKMTTTSTDTHDLTPSRIDHQTFPQYTKPVTTDQASQTIDSHEHQGTQTLAPQLKDQANGDFTINYTSDSSSQTENLPLADQERSQKEQLPLSSEPSINSSSEVTEQQLSSSQKQATEPSLQQRLLSLHHSLKEIENIPLDELKSQRLPQTGNQIDNQATVVGLLLVAGVALCNLYWLSKFFHKNK